MSPTALCHFLLVHLRCGTVKRLIYNLYGQVTLQCNSMGIVMDRGPRGGKSKARPDLVTEILAVLFTVEKDCEVRFCWVLGHTGIERN